MAYVALYRRYRPLTFADMVGQEHITKILKNQLKTGKVSHAYIFSGTRGTGKTTAAKVFARAINCLNPKDGEPCNECEACKSILEGNSTDVVEMDAASNNGVDNIRTIRQEVAYSTTGLKYKVYIIDEVHMLSAGAFNALLKTLEEPPANVVFILATTEEHKILPTILSRCIRFEFKKIGKPEIIERLKYVLGTLNVGYEEEALERIAYLADGGMRDALSILERCVNASSGDVTAAKVEEIVGTVPADLIESLVINILDNDVNSANKTVNKILEKGKDLRNINDAIIEEFLNILIGLSSEWPDTISDTVKEAAEGVSVARVNLIIKHLSKLDEDLRQSTNGSVLFKAKMLELATKVPVLDENMLLNKIQELEMKLEEVLRNPPAPTKSTRKQDEKAEDKKVEVKQESSVDNVEKEVKKEEKSVKLVQVKAGKKQLKELSKIMQRASDEDNLKVFSALAGTEAFIEDDTVTFSTKNGFAYGVLNKDTSKDYLKTLVEDEIERDVNIRIEYITEDSKDEKSFEQMMQGTDVPFQVID
ncbi:MAG: DNA polymerase III subunit gamma/tau [Clostridia bacterium]|nr:DNA polymerase III subunit gamma/tau [Clostridia bacterium]